MLMLAAVWSGLVLASRSPLDVPVILTWSGVVSAALALCAGRRASTLVLAAGIFLIGALRSPDMPARPQDEDFARWPGGRFPVVLRLRLPFLVGQCRETVHAAVDSVLVGDPGLRGRRVILRGLGLDRRRGQRTVVVSGVFRAPQPPRNPFAPDLRKARRRQGVAGSVTVDSVLEDRCAAPDRVLAGVRRAVGRLIAGVPEREARGVLEATLLGARSGILPDVERAMIRAGAYHVLAISGLHVGILVFMVSMFVTVVRLGRTWRVLVGVVLVFAYVVFAGARPSALRAGTFLLILSAGRLLEWKVDPANAVCFAATALLLAFPALAWDLGFRLSFGAVLGMTLFLPVLARPTVRASLPARALALLEAGLLASFSAQVFTMPLILWTFGRVSIIACAANLIVLPLMSLALAAGIEAAVLAALLPGLASIFMRSASLLVVAALRAAEALTAGFNPLVCPGRPSVTRACTYYGVVMWLGLAGGRLGRRTVLAVLGSAFALMLAHAPGRGGRGTLDVTFLYVGSGDACVLESPDGRTVVVDAGAVSSDYSAASSVILPFLALRGIDSVDRLVVTHPHGDHYGGLPALIDNLEVGGIVVATTDGDRGYRACLDGARRCGVPVTVARAGDRWETGGVVFEVLHPGRPEGPGLDPAGLEDAAGDPNAWSLVIKVTYGERSLLLTGDLTPAMQDSLVARGVDLRCDVLKVPHHGHPGAVTASFAGALGARVAVISCGAKYFAEPDVTTPALLAGAGMKPLSTRVSGAVSVRTDGRNLGVSTVLGGPQKVFQWY